MGFTRQEYWSGLHFLLQGIFPTQGSNTKSLALAGRFFITEPLVKPSFMWVNSNYHKASMILGHIKKSIVSRKWDVLVLSPSALTRQHLEMGRGCNIGKEHVNSHFPRIIKILSWQVCLPKNFLSVSLFLNSQLCCCLGIVTVNYNNQGTDIGIMTEKYTNRTELRVQKYTYTYNWFRQRFKGTSTKKKVFSTNGAGTIVYLNVKTYRHTTFNYSYHIQKVTQNRFIDLNGKPKSIKLIEET